MSELPYSLAGSAHSLFQSWVGLLPDALGTMAGFAVAAVVVLCALEFGRRRSGGELAPLHRLVWLFATLIAALVVGYRAVIENASLFDDAFISFRYIDNWLQGHGLVWNPGERVEGYTNFLWTLLVAGLSWLTPWGPPEWGLLLSLACFGVNLVLVAVLGRQLMRGWVAPGVTLGLLALSRVFTDYGSTGMETGFGAALVLGAGIFLAREGSVRSAAGAGTLLILATLNRQDHSLFFIAGGLALLVDQLLVLRQAGLEGSEPPRKEALLRLLAFSAPFLPYLLYLGWKLHYYGDILPNTYYAKSGDLSWWSQGWRYTAMFYLTSGAWLATAVGLGWLLLPSRDHGTRRFKIFFVVGLVLFDCYVMKVGGDFMYGRFFVTVLPLTLLAAEACGVELWRRSVEGGRLPVLGLVVLALLASTASEVPLLGDRKIMHGVADESAVYPLEQFFPPVVGHRSWRTGNSLGAYFTDRGIDVSLGSGGIGMIGYYGRTEVLDLRGLTDPVVARQVLEKRGRPGHEKSPPPGYIEEKGIQLLRRTSGLYYRHPKRFRKLAKVTFEWEGRGCQPLMFTHWDQALADQIAAKSPEVNYVDFPGWLDRYIARLDKKKRRQVRKDFNWFKKYYFDHNDDAPRKVKIETWLASRRAKER